MNQQTIGKELADLLQTKFPLTGHPYADIGAGLGINEAEVIDGIRQLKADGLIRQIGPVFDARRLGYRTTLVAMKLPEDNMDQASGILREHPRISHAYERDHHFNLWFTLAAPKGDDIEAELPEIGEQLGAEAFCSLPATRLFKLRTNFAMGGRQAETTHHHTQPPQREAKLSGLDRMVVNELQQDLPLTPSPFKQMAVRLGIDEEELLSTCRSLLRRGIMRRFGAAVNHRKAGFAANAMTCWIVPPEKIEIAGNKLAAERAVSHCYIRQTNPHWQHNLFAMIHGHAREDCREVADRISAETGLGSYLMLYSTREFKKQRIKYLV